MNWRTLFGCGFSGFLAGLLGLAGCSAGGNADSLVVGKQSAGGSTNGSPGSGGFVSLSGDAGASKALAAHIESPAGITVEFITLSCSNTCADVLAVAIGGAPPYSFRWDDGSPNPNRHVCPSSDTAYTVSVTDQGIKGGEFSRPPETVSARVTASVIDCPTADAGPGGAPPIRDAGHAPACTPGDSTPPEELTPDIFGAPAYFSGGASLPAGRYRVSYVDGCMKYDGTWSWTVQGSPPIAGFQFQWVLIGAGTSDVLGLLPGTAAPVAYQGYGTYDDCVAANRAVPPLDFDFSGGKLGIWQDDWKPDDNIAGAKSPTWRLSRLPCP